MIKEFVIGCTVAAYNLCENSIDARTKGNMRVGRSGIVNRVKCGYVIKVMIMGGWL